MFLSQKLFIAVSAIVIVFWGLFVFDENFASGFSILFNNEKYPAKPLEEQFSENQLENKIKTSNTSVSPQTLVTEIKNNEIVKNEPDLNPKLTEYKKQKEEKKLSEQLLENNLKNLEKKMFELKAKGKTWEGAPQNSKDASISLKLKPVDGMRLDQFELTEGKIIMGGNSFNFKAGSAEITDSEILIIITSKGNSSPFATLKGILDLPTINSDYNVGVKFENQLFYLNTADRTPFHMNFDGKLYSRE